MKNHKTKDLVSVSLYAALIFIAIQFLKIPLAHQFIHIGNALVVIGILIFGFKKGFLSALLGLGIFDILNGYAASVWMTLLEAFLVCLVINFYFVKILKGKDNSKLILSVALLAALLKIILNLVKYTLINHFIANISFSSAISLAVIKILGTFGSALVTLIAVPILYPIFKSFTKNVIK
ncbi:MAG: ECF transporter S component [Streptococcus sp.]|nr:ECF transporter S component [Streptococcus sp.]